MYKTGKPLGKVSIDTVGAYVSIRCGSMSHLKLQKILFYVQAYHLAVFAEPLFDDDFEAWVHGPVNRKLYNQIRDHSLLYREVVYTPSKDEILPSVILEKELIPYQLSVINEVVDELKDTGGLQLEAMTHSEDPWINARRGVQPGDRCTNIIPKDEIMQYYTNKYCGKA